MGGLGGSCVRKQNDLETFRERLRALEAERERFQRTVLDEFYRVAFRTKLYRSIEELQEDLDVWLRQYDEERPHSGRYCYGKTPMQTFMDAMPMTREKIIGYEMTAWTTEGG